MITDIETYKLENTKHCRRCGKDRPVTEFCVRKETRKGLRAWCNPCRRLQARGYYHRRCYNDPEEIRQWRARHFAKHIRKHYGITMEEYELLSSKQDGRCTICNKKPKKRLVVDHDHKTNKIRGMLCSPCNRALGALGDSVDGLQSAILYLQGSAS